MRLEDGIRKHEKAILISIGLLFILVNAITSVKSPTVWVDEVSYADPAVNLVLNGNFTSTGWGMVGEKLWYGNVPLYPMVLAGWLEIFGVSPTAVRSMNYLLVLVGVYLLWFVLYRTKLTGPQFRVIAVLLLLCGEGITYAYRAGRPDVLGFVLVSIGVASLLFEKRTRYLVLGVAAALVPWAGLQFIPFVVLLCASIVLWDRSLFKETTLPVAVGGIAGAGALLLFYRANGVLNEFMASVFPHTAAGEFGGFGWLQLYTEDLSYFLLTTVCLAYLAYSWIRHNLDNISPVFGYGLLIGLVSPLLLRATGKYLLYYTWMAYFPIVLGVCVQAKTIRWKRWKIWGGLIVVGLACMWLPARVGLSVVQWEARSYEPVRKLADETITQRDTVYTTYGAYYPVKREASKMYMPSFGIDVVKILIEKEIMGSVDKVIIDPRKSKEFFERVGGEWRKIGQIGRDAKRKEILGRKLATPYRLATYVRLSSEE